MSGKNIPFSYKAESSFGEAIRDRNCFKLILVESGAGVINIGTRKLAFDAPMLLCFNEQDEIDMVIDSNVKAKALYFHPQFINRNLTFESLRRESGGLNAEDAMDASLLRPFVVRDALLLGQFDIGPDAFKKAAELFFGIQKELAEQSCKYWLCRLRAYLLEFLILLEQLFPIDKAYGEPQLMKVFSEMDQVLLYLHLHYRYKITIPDLCAAFHMNRTTLQKKFQSIAAVSLMSYLIRYRIRLATYLLRNTELPIYEIVERLGFNDNAHFTKMFKKHLNCTPNEYRQTNFRLLK